jgi:outer membrane protein assembly factor BamB
MRGLLSALVLVWLASGVRGEDWPQWGGHGDRNMVATAMNLPSCFVPGKKCSGGTNIDLKTARNVRWVARLGSETYSSPVVAGGKLFIGTNDFDLDDPRFQNSGGGQVLAMDVANGRLLWRLAVPKLESKQKSSQFDEMGLGVCSTPTVEGNRVYLVTNRCEVLSLDVNGQADGNDGPFKDEARYEAGPAAKPFALVSTDADIIWRYDIIQEHKVWPHDAANCSVLIWGDLLYVGTANGVEGQKCPSPLAPSLIVLDKKSGRLAAYDDEKIGARVFHGQWSSPSLGKVGGKTQVYFGAGDGICYAFEALDHVPQKPAPLKKVWSFNCNPPEYLVRNGKPIDYWDGDCRKHRGNCDDGCYVGPSEIIATPVFHNNRVYVAVGQDPLHGRGRGMLNCIDATQTGDISRSGRLWSYDKLDRSLSTVSIADGLVYVADRPGRIHCLDAETGRCYWVQDVGGEIWGSTLVADGKLFVGTRKAFCVLAAGKTPKLLAQINLGTPVWSTPAVAANTLFVASQRHLWAVQAPAPHGMLAAR